MTAAELLQGLKARGATVAANGDRLKLAAPPGVLSARVLDFAAKHKTELLALLQSDALAPGEIPPADGLARRGAFIMPTRESLPAHRAHFEAKAESASTQAAPDSDRQAERIRRLTADISPAELLAAHRTIKPTLKKSLTAIDLHELALTLADAQKCEKSRTSAATRPAREFYPADAYQSEKGKGDSY